MDGFSQRSVIASLSFVVTTNLWRNATSAINCGTRFSMARSPGDWSVPQFARSDPDIFVAQEVREVRSLARGRRLT
jgi:hypothetical protein